jgi:hypothetical protein
MQDLFLRLLVCRCSLLLIGPSELLCPVLPLLPLLPGRLLNLGSSTNSYFSIMWLEIRYIIFCDAYLKFLEVGFRVVDQCESGRLSTTELSAETKCLDSLFGGFVEGGKAGADFIFGKIRLGRVKDVNDLQKLECRVLTDIQIACG